MPESDLQHDPPMHASPDHASGPPTTQLAKWQQPPLPSLRPTRVQAQEVQAREEGARFDAVLADIRRQKEIAGEHAARQAVTGIQHEEAAGEAEVAATAESDQASVTRGRSCTRAALCGHQVRWISVPGRSRCEYHLYSKNAYRNPFRFRCPECKTVACGLCMKKLKRGDML